MSGAIRTGTGFLITGAFAVLVHGTGHGGFLRHGLQVHFAHRTGSGSVIRLALLAVHWALVLSLGLELNFGFFCLDFGSRFA